MCDKLEASSGRCIVACANRVLICCCSFFKSYLQQLRHMVREGFVSEQHVDHIIVESDVTKLLNRVSCSLPPIHLFVLCELQPATYTPFCFVLMLIECN
jgi:hypothetical protein